MDASDARAIICGRPGTHKVQETFIRLGRRRLFGIVSEPLGEAHGPLVVFFNAANEEHIGPSRLWVELSRGWSADGLRCVRFDLTGVGDSPSFAKQPTPLWYEKEWLEDVQDVISEMRPQDPADVVLIGLCSGAYLAAEGALMFSTRGACLVNPPVGTDLLHASVAFRKSQVKGLRSMAALLRFLHIHGPWLGTGLWQVLRMFLPRRYSEDLIAKVARGSTTLLVMSSADDLSPYTVPFLRSIDRRRVAAPKNYHVEFVPGLDHSMHAAKGRVLAVASLDRFVRDEFIVVDSVNSSDE